MAKQQMKPAKPSRAGYRVEIKPPDDSDIQTRNRPIRILVMLLTIVLLIVIPTGFAVYLGSLSDNGYILTLAAIVGFCLGGEIVARVAPARLFIYNQEWTGYVTNNAFIGKMVTYGPGVHPSFPWEVRAKKGNWPLRVITKSFSPAVATMDAKATVSGKYEYAMNLALLERAVGIDESTIDSGITAFIESFLTRECAGKTIDDVRKSIDQLNENLAEEFMRAESDDPSIPKIGDKYGFITVSVIVDGIRLPEAVQKTRDAKDEAKQLFEVVANMYGLDVEELKRRVRSGELKTEEYNTMLNRAMAASDNNASMTVQVIEGDAGAALAGAATRLVRGEGK